MVVPNDRLDADVVGVALRLPPDFELESARATQPLWSVSPSGDVVTWQGGPIARASSETFSFTARMPSQAGRVELTLLETYDDGDAAPFPISLDVRSASSDGGGGATGSAALVVAILALGVATAALLLALRANRRSSPS